MQIDFFYNLDTREDFACRFLARAWANDEVWRVALDDARACEAFSAKLWSFSPSSFLPHKIEQAEPIDDFPLVLLPFLPSFGVQNLLNLSAQALPASARLVHVIELVCEQTRQAQRERAKLYQAAGFKVQFHDAQLLQL